MKSYIQITGKYLRTQKKRSVLTVIGIVLSVALITGIGTIFMGWWQGMIDETIKGHGAYHAGILDVPGGKADPFIRNAQVAEGGVAQDLGYAAFAANKTGQPGTPFKYYRVTTLDEQAMNLLPLQLKEGRLPAAPGEIAVDYWTVAYIKSGLKLGDAISIDYGKRTLPDGTELIQFQSYNSEKFTKTESRQYTIVGFLQPPFIMDRNFAQAYTWLDKSALSDSGKYTVYIKLKSTGDAYNRIAKIVESSGIAGSGNVKDHISYNESLLRLVAQSINKNLNNSMITVLIVVVCLVILSTIAVIYNAFNISVVERVRQFGLLRCVGATPAQIKKIVFREAFTLGAIGIPIGVVCGTVAIGLIFQLIGVIAPGTVQAMTKLVIDPWIVLLSMLIGALTIYLSALLPARKAGKIAPMDAVRGTGIIKKEKYGKPGRLRLLLRLLGAEGWMAWKNLRRNRKRFYITVLSMVISIVLFIVFNSLVKYAYGTGMAGTNEMANYSLYNAVTGQAVSLKDSDYAALRAAGGVERVIRAGRGYIEVSLPSRKVNAGAAELIKPQADGDTLRFAGSNLLCYGNDSMDLLGKHLAQGNLDISAMNAGNGVILVNSDLVRNRAKERSEVMDVTSLKPGDSITVHYDMSPEDGSFRKTVELKIAAVLSEGIQQDVRNENGGLNIIASEELFRQLAGADSYPSAVNVEMDPKADRTAVKSWLEGFVASNPDHSYMDLDEVARQSNAAITVLGIFLYGFVAVISLIGCLNIINTISTNIILRTRELSIMRAVGMTENGIRKMICMESLLHGAIAALIGSAAGVLLSWLLYGSISNARSFPWELPWQQILIAVFAAALVAVISGFVPLKRINKGVIMEGIRGEE